MLHATRLTALSLALTACLCASTPAAPPLPLSPSPALPLSSRIDSLIESAAVGPLAPLCSDADFVRRIYLDLTGVIPNAQQARDFVADTAPDKREKLIDDLLASPDFLRHMTITLDVMLMERKPEKVVKQPEWEGFLYAALADDKPLDQLFSEMISADGAEEPKRPPAKFLLDRDAEPNLLTRDIGRLVFGMDLQCCQCHDHPLIDDYYQDDYYGLFAFVHRTTLFTDSKTKQISLTEKADGEASFKSVFTGASSDKAQPRLPKGAILFIEPTFAKGEEYSVKPDKTVRGIPKFSRRATLAEMLPGSREFSCNLANRLWAHLLSRGLVHPLDFHYAANPPSNPQLLTVLADELATGNFKLRPLIREISLSHTYQRSCDPPRPETINFADISARKLRLVDDKKALQNEIQPLKEALAKSKTDFKSARELESKLATELPKLESAVANARKAHDASSALRRSAELAATKLREQSQSVAEAAAKLTEVAAKLSEDQVLAEAASKTSALALELSTALEKSDKTLADRAADETATAAQLAAAEQALTTAQSSRPTPQQLRTLEQAQLTAEHRLADANNSIAAIDSQTARAQAILDYAVLAKTDPVKAEAAWSHIIQQWTIAGQIAPLKPLTPEQLAASTMQATDMLQPRIAAVKAKLEKTNPLHAAEQVAGKLKVNFVLGGIKHLVDQGRHEADRSADAAAAAEKLRHRTMLEQRELLTQLRGTFTEFVRQYGGLPGEEFQATVSQALFFGNGPTVDSWLKPSGQNLVARLAKIDDHAQLADDLHWSVFSRSATEAEKQATAAYLKDHTDKPAALAEITWALLSSTEFRFNH